jgi:hypothetical protein
LRIADLAAVGKIQSAAAAELFRAAQSGKVHFLLHRSLAFAADSL